MAPPAAIDTSSDILPRSKPTTSTRTLLLSPPSLSSHPEKLNLIVEAHDRHAADIQMLDRLSLSLVQLPPLTYSTILILTDADNTRAESRSLLTREVIAYLVTALKPGGVIRSQDGTFASAAEPAEKQEAILAGLLVGENGVTKPDYDTTTSVPLRFGKPKPSEQTTPADASVNNGTAPNGATSITSPAATGVVSMNIDGKRQNGPVGVGFVDFSDDLDAPVEEEDSDDELIDENTLLEESDFARPIVQPLECRPKPGKRRRACKDCTCGLAAKIAAEDATKRSEADQKLAKLQASDLAEVDFTVQGKVGSCGNCALGDAFRCDGCPYIGLPAFKPGEEVRLPMEDEGEV